MKRIVTTFALLLTGLLYAQVPVVPPELLDETRRLDGDHMRICVFEGRASTAFDSAVAAAVADSLLLTHELITVPASFPLFDDSDFFYALYLHLMNDCDLFAGINLMAGVFPDWLMASADYISIPFVLAVVDPEIESLADLPRDQALGVQLGGIIDMELINYYNSGAEQNGWLRLPYADDELMLRRLKDGTVGGALMWLPSVLQHTDGDPLSEGIHLAGLRPLQPVGVDLAFVFLSSEPFMGGMVNQAIEALRSTGYVNELAREYGFFGESL